MNERVTVTHPRRSRPRVRPMAATAEIDEQTGLGEVYITSLVRSQFRLSLAVVVVSLGLLALLPLVFHLLPGSTEVEVLGIGLPWILLGAVVYPVLVVTAWFYVRNAERVERDFVDLLHRR